MNPVAVIRSCYPEKFGIPRQSGLVEEATATLVFEPGYRNPDIVRGLEGFSHIWLLWLFHANRKGEWSPTVRPPRLGGNTRVGVFATRSPYRPNPIGLSAVKLLDIDHDHPEGPMLHLSGVDIMDGTPVIDIKPYIPYADSIPGATGGFAPQAPEAILNVDIPDDLRRRIDPAALTVVTRSLALDPRPSFHGDPCREYGMSVCGCNIKFRVEGDTLRVTAIEHHADR